MDVRATGTAPIARATVPEGADIGGLILASPRRGATRAGEGDLRRELRQGRQAADCAAQDRGEQQIPADLDRPPGGCRDPDEGPGRLHAAPDDPRSALRHAWR